MSHALPIGPAARELGVPVGTLRRWIREGAPVVRRGRRGGLATLVDLQALESWRQGDDEMRLLLAVANDLPDLLAAAMLEAHRLTDGAHKRAVAGVLAGAWLLCASTVLDRIRRDCPAVGELTSVPEQIERLRLICGRSASFGSRTTEHDPEDA